MKRIFKSRKKGVLDRLDDLEIKIDRNYQEIKNQPSKREKILEDMIIDMKSKKIASYEEIIKQLKSELGCSREVTDSLSNKLEKIEKELKKSKETVEAFRCDLEIAQKKIQDFKDKGIAIPRKIRSAGPTKETKQICGLKRGQAKVSVNKILKEVSENNLGAKNENSD